MTDDTLGFDIHSYDTDGRDRFVEVKTTHYARYTRFYITPKELDASRKLDSRYLLYRVFTFRSDPRFYTRQGRIEDHFELEPALFVAGVGE